MNISFITERKTITSSSEANEIIDRRKRAVAVILAQISAAFFGFSRRVIYRLIEAGKVRFIKTENNEIYVCSLSVKQFLRQSVDNSLAYQVSAII